MLAGRLTLGKRMVLLAVLGLAVVALLFAYLSMRSLQEASDRALHERLVAAQLTARHVDNFLGLYLSSLDEAARTEGLDLNDADPGVEARLLERLYGARGRVGSGYLLLDSRGAMIWGEPPTARSGPVEPVVRALADQVVGSGRSCVSQAFVDAQGRSMVALGAPVWDGSGQPVGALVALWGFSDPLLGGFVQPVSLGRTGRAEIVDGGGMVLASSDQSHLLRKSDHTDQFARMIRAGQPLAAACHSCHESGQAQPDILAFAPLSVAPWGIAIRQLEEEALAPARELRQSLVVASLGLLLVVVVGVGIGSQGVVRPLGLLASASRRIAAGDLESPVDPVGPAEIGQLARALDEMRQKLKVSLEEREKLRRNLLERVIAAQEEERRRVARDLHDDTCQSLVALGISLQELEDSLPGSASAARSTVARLKAQARATLAGARALALDLRPSVLDDLGLEMAVDWYAKERLGRAGMAAKVVVEGARRDLPQPLATVLFRIAQEALNNVARHSGASSASVRLSFRDATVALEVEDDGAGFDVERALSPENPRQGLGLHGMIERAALSGGKLEVVSSPGQGTRIGVELPLI